MTKPLRQFVLASAAAVAATLVLLAWAVPGAIGAKPVTGKLDKAGYTVIALAKNGEARSDRAGQGKFKVRSPAKRVTLHLRAEDGTYGGPVVVGRKHGGEQAIVGLEAGAKLGRIEVRAGKGYAKPAKWPAKKWVDRDLLAKARKGVPIGAGNFGLVKSKKEKGSADLDLDGLPATLDVDDDGDLVLDDYDRSSKARASGTGAARRDDQPGVTWPDGSHIQLSTSLGGIGMKDGWPVNVNGGATNAEIATQQQRLGALNVLWTGLDPGSGELDCGSLIYCTVDGTGRWSPPGLVTHEPRKDTVPLSECCDDDGDGLISLRGTIEFPDGNEVMAISHGATPDQIRAGDVVIERGTVNGEAQESAAAVGFVFATHPVIAAYDDGQGNSETFEYPPDEPCRSFYPGLCSVPVSAAPGGDLVLELTFWRPQRPGIEGEPGEAEWMDVGHLAYTLSVQNAANLAQRSTCPQSSYSETDPDLRPLPAGIPLPMFVKSEDAFEDVSGDQPVDRDQPFANTFSTKLNLTQCYSSLGWAMPPDIGITLWATPLASGADSGPQSFVSSETHFLQQP